ncbi:MAG: hypothetical protein Q8O92_08525 [Candidatus Latescibacter sp.]|nr:hypothetical protein [Candidatus Latescibacter sp.]
MSKKTQIGNLPPRYSFMLNPYQDFRSTKCPMSDLFNHTADFKEHYDLKIEPGGWRPAEDKQ